MLNSKIAVIAILSLALLGFACSEQRANQPPENDTGMQSAGTTGTGMQSEADARIEEQFRASLQENNLQGNDIDVHSENGRLTISGQVDSQDVKDQLRQIAEAIPDVQDVNIDVRVRQE